MSAIRDRSVVRSSVIPSAKYCWSGSLLRLAKGRTAIDRRGAANGCAVELVAATATAPEGMEVVLGASQTHQANAAMASIPAPAAATGAALLRPERSLAVCASGLGTASSFGMAATVSGVN